MEYLVKINRKGVWHFQDRRLAGGGYTLCERYYMDDDATRRWVGDEAPPGRLCRSCLVKWLELSADIERLRREMGE